VIVFGILPSLLSELKAEVHSPEYLLVGRRPSFERDSRTELASAVTFAVAPAWIAVAVTAMEAAREMNLMLPRGVSGCSVGCRALWLRRIETLGMVKRASLAK
jgi:hypothetical protein